MRDSTAFLSTQDNKDTNSIDPIDILKLNDKLKSHNYYLYFSKKTLSTNTDLLKLSTGEAFHKTVLITDEQTQGKGRQGRSWHAQPGKSLLFSCLWRFKKQPEMPGSLSLAVGVSLTKSLQTLGIEEIGLKWPNDLLTKNRFEKIGGILLEAPSKQSDHQYAIVIGVGLNVYPQSINLPAAYRYNTLSNYATKPMTRNQILAQILIDLDNTLNLFEKEGLAPFIDDWNNFFVWHHHEVTATLSPDQTITGRCLGIDASGALQLSVSGKDAPISLMTGDITLRKCYDRNNG